ncbi:hypothetical protein [Bremerella sp.]|uniref:hypothetical protein n=1 Tax=Bremerella sp. TaxID=2795602 RepID=UPI00391879D9
MSSVRFQLRDLVWGFICLALILGWLSDHVRQQVQLDERDISVLLMLNRLNGLIRQYEFETDKTIEQDEHALWIVDHEAGSRLPITGKVHKAKPSSSLEKDY